MSHLSGFLKRNFYSQRQAMGPFRRWAETHSDVFDLSKRGGKWMLSLVHPNGLTPNAGMDASGSMVPTFYGVEKWVYFRCNKELASLLQRAKVLLSSLLIHSVEAKGKDSFGNAGNACKDFIESIRAAVLTDDDPPVYGQR